ncbi:hypothetical protein BpHYR1_026608 [Brachionus plicatilis]|uniref:Uncharacterized protein n=1 Tax=Brachionus plicatilis TaxID=10195 RepID=A0A3M7Q7I7_BRAPC|nr:hypothetical protein BpHYR1_026608 [Brachionus plicatilis]
MAFNFSNFRTRKLFDLFFCQSTQEKAIVMSFWFGNLQHVSPLLTSQMMALLLDSHGTVAYNCESKVKSLDLASIF